MYLCDYFIRYLTLNQLSGTIPPSIGNLAKLQDLYVHSCFQFRQQNHIITHSCNPNFSIFVWFFFRWLNDNLLSGAIPSSIGNLVQLTWLYVDSFFQFHQQSPSKLILSTQTSLFIVILFRDLSSNLLTGTIPSSIGNLTQLQWLYVHSCFQFHQQTHIALTRTTLCMFRELYNNSFSGVIPQALCQHRYQYGIEIFPNNGVFTCPLPTCCVFPFSCAVFGSASCSNDTKTTSDSTSNLFCCYYDSVSQLAVSICSTSSCPPPHEGYSFFSSAPTPSCSRCNTLP